MRAGSMSGSGAASPSNARSPAASSGHSAGDQCGGHSRRGRLLQPGRDRSSRPSSLPFPRPARAPASALRRIKRRIGLAPQKLLGRQKLDTPTPAAAEIEHRHLVARQHKLPRCQAMPVVRTVIKFRKASHVHRPSSPEPSGGPGNAITSAIMVLPYVKRTPRPHRCNPSGNRSRRHAPAVGHDSGEPRTAPCHPPIIGPEARPSHRCRSGGRWNSSSPSPPTSTAFHAS